MYKEFYQFREKPFSLTPDPEFLYRSRAHKRALAYLQYGILDPSGFVCITGEIGAGKTTLIRVFLDQLKDQVNVARLFNTRISSRQLMEMILQDLGLDYQAKTKTVMIETLNNYLIETYAQGKRVVLIIDEAQNLSEDLLEEIRLLSNLETEKTKLLQIILVGQSELRDNLKLPSLEQFRQRITVNYHIPPLDRDETGAYMRHRVQVASEGPVVSFPEPVIDIVYDYSGGVPRLINVICDTLLLYGFVEEKRDPDEEMIQEVIKDMIQEGTLSDPMAEDPEPEQDRDSQEPSPNTFELLKNKINELEKKQALSERSIEFLVENNQSLENKGTELLERLEEVHRREQMLAVRQEKLNNKEADLIRRERLIREFLQRARNEKTAEEEKSNKGNA
jgi:putative secretion ATPase (PEP-CTERM system associated)